MDNRADHSSPQCLVLGNFGLASQLVESMLGDDRIQGATQGRLKGVTKCDAFFTPSELDEDESISDEIQTLWPDIVPEETLEALLTWSTFLYFALIEKIWEVRTVKGQQRWVPRLKVWSPYYIYYDISLRKFIAITQEGLVQITPGEGCCSGIFIGPAATDTLLCCWVGNRNRP